VPCLLLSTAITTLRQAEIDAGEAAGVSSEENRELPELGRKNSELESTIEILKAATSFFARDGKGSLMLLGRSDFLQQPMTGPAQNGLIPVGGVQTRRLMQ
jgi:hypothetical protein